MESAAVGAVPGVAAALVAALAGMLALL
jgi:hypothetical protein